jgi:methylated-DNA-protein-cysteine methyltransferase-like protein
MANQSNTDSFFERVYEVVKLIPYGRVTSYGAVARYLGSGQSARMVGWAMNLAHVTDASIPAHRVVNRVGLLSGKHHFIGKSMQQRLEEEGILVKDDTIVDFNTHFWNPEKELSL